MNKELDTKLDRAAEELAGKAGKSGPPEGLDQALALHARIHGVVGTHEADLRELIPRKFNDEEWKLRGSGLVVIFMALEIQLEMLRECPSTTMVHFSGVTSVHCHHLLAQMLGVEVGGTQHVAAVAVVSASLEGQYHAGAQPIH